MTHICMSCGLRRVGTFDSTARQGGEMSQIKVKDVMFTAPFMVRPTQRVIEAASLMEEIDCGILPVGEENKAVGIITDRDITLRVTAQGKDALRTPVKEVMTKSICICDEECT